MKLLLNAALKSKKHFLLAVFTLFTLFLLTVANSMEMFALGLMANKGCDFFSLFDSIQNKNEEITIRNERIVYSDTDGLFGISLYTVDDFSGVDLPERPKDGYKIPFQEIVKRVSKFLAPMDAKSENCGFRQNIYLESASREGNNVTVVTTDGKVLKSIDLDIEIEKELSMQIPQYVWKQIGRWKEDIFFNFND